MQVLSHVGLVRRLPRRVAIVALALVLFAASYVLRLAVSDVADVPLLLFVIPIALCAVEFGVRGGLAASAFGMALTVSWYVIGDHPIGPIGYLSRGVALVVVGGLVGHFADVRRALERQISRHQELTLDLVATAGFDGYFKRLNPAWERTLGYRQSELLSRPFLDFVHPDDRERTQAEAGKLAQGGHDSVNFRNRYQTSDGSYRWLEWTARGSRDDGLIYAGARDITERLQAEEALTGYKEVLERTVQQRTSDLEHSRLELLERLALAAEYRDDDTHEHTERVARIVMLLAKELGLEEDEIERLTRAAPLHDIGKIGVSDTILLKPGKLTTAEFELMKTHVGVGASIVHGSTSAILRLAEEIVLTHHERWDGAGYPAGLRGEEIPLSGRIVAVADVFDALTHTRPYKAAWPMPEAVTEIMRQSGKQFDPRVVAAFGVLDHGALVDFVPGAARLALAV